MVSMVKDETWTENTGIKCYGEEFNSWEGGTEVRNRALKVSKTEGLATRMIE